LNFSESANGDFVYLPGLHAIPKLLNSWKGEFLEKLYSTERLKWAAL